MNLSSTRARRNVTVHLVADGEQAFAFLNRAGTYAAAPRPNLVLLDLNLAKKDGYRSL